MYAISIRQRKPLPGTNADEHFHVRVGCKKLVYTDKAKLIADFTAYIGNPEAMEKKATKTDAPSIFDTTRIPLFYPPTNEEQP